MVEFEIGIFCGVVVVVVEIDLSKILNNDFVLFFLFGFVVFVLQFNICSIFYYVQVVDFDVGIIGVIVVDDFRIDLIQFGIDVYVFFFLRGLIDQILFGDVVGYCSSDIVGIVLMEVLDKELKFDNIVEFYEEGFLQVVFILMVIELEDRNDSLGVILDVFIFVEKFVLLLEVYGEIEELKNLKVDFVSDVLYFFLV